MIERYKSNRNYVWLFIGISTVSILGWFTNTYSPDSLNLIVWFFVLIFVSVFSLSLFIFNNVRRALWTSSGILIILLLRYFNLREVLYPILLIACIVSLELYSQKR